MPTPREELASLLRDSRKAAGFKSHGALAKVLHVSRSLIAKAESVTQPLPTETTLRGYADQTGVELDTLTEIVERAKSGSPEWFMPYESEEAKATMIRCWSPWVVPGLGQTRAYMRHLFNAEGHLVDRVDELTEARLKRQDVIGRAHVTLVIGGQALSYQVGPVPEVMAEQCARLITLAGNGVALHILPANTNMGVWGAFDLASRDSTVTVRMDAIRDVTSKAPDMVDEAMLAFERLLGAALPRDQSLEFMRAMEEQWKAKTT